MKGLKIREIRPNRNGLGGLKVIFSRIQQGKDGLSYTNHFSVDYTMPVNRDLVKLWDGIKGYFAMVMGFEDGVESNLVWLRCDGQNKISGGLRVLSSHEKWFAANVPVITCDEEVREYGVMLEIIDEIWGSVAKYIIGELLVEPKQYMLDLHVEGKRKNKDLGYTKEDVELMSSSEAFDRMREILEDQGDVFLIKSSEIEDAETIS